MVKKLVNIMQLCTSAVLVLQLILLGLITAIKFAILWLIPLYAIIIVLNVLSFFQISSFKKSKIVAKVFKFIVIFLVVIIAWLLAWLIQILNSHYSDSVFLHISFTIVVALYIVLAVLEIRNNKNSKENTNE